MGTGLQTVTAFVAATVVAATFVAGTLVAGAGCTDPYAIGADAGGGGGGAQTEPSTRSDTDVPNDPNPSTTKTEAAPLTDAGAPTAPCEPQQADWSVGGASCSVMTDHLEPGASETVKDSTPDDTGSVTVTCVGGTLAYSGAICEPPKVFAVDSPTGCVSGYCIGVVGGHCGMPDPARADAFCVFKGYAAATTFKTGPGVNGARQCAADGSSCFVNANPSCNIILTSVTCRH